MRAVAVWDLPTRLFHWLLVVAVVVSYMTGGEEGSWFVVHTLSGYAVAVLLLFRLVWGFIGSPRSRFADFVHGGSSVRDYAKRLARLDPPRFVGHNPLGGWMVLAMLVVLVGTVITGLFSGEEDGPGSLLLPLIAAPGGEGFGEVHETLGNLIIVLACAHILGVFVDWFLTGDNLVRAIITGNKVLDADAASRERPLAGTGRALAVAALAAIVGVVLVRETDFSTLSSASVETTHGEEAAEDDD